jgi:hypothetical protein
MAIVEAPTVGIPWNAQYFDSVAAIGTTVRIGDPVAYLLTGWDFGTARQWGRGGHERNRQDAK